VTDTARAPTPPPPKTPSLDSISTSFADGSKPSKEALIRTVEEALEALSFTAVSRPPHEQSACSIASSTSSDGSTEVLGDGGDSNVAVTPPIETFIPESRPISSLPAEPSTDGPRVLLIAPGLSESVFPLIALARELIVTGFNVAISAHVSSWVDVKQRMCEEDFASLIRFFALDGDPKEFVQSSKFREVCC
jgi:hypothetical protein